MFGSFLGGVGGFTFTFGYNTKHEMECCSVPTSRRTWNSTVFLVAPTVSDTIDGLETHASRGKSWDGHG